MTRWIAAWAAALPAVALAHGINGHVHVTGWAIDALPPGPLKALLADPVVRDTALIAAAFPDSGYAIGDGYGELAHWEPFVDACVRRLQPPFETLEAQREAAFVLGLAAHGLQDELFDSLFLYQIAKHDDRGQDEADPGTDAFLVTDGYVHHRPPVWVPYALVQAALEDAHDYAVSADTIDAGMARVKTLVIDGAEGIARVFDPRYRPQLPWTAEHYVDPDIPGSLGAEIPATRAYLEALWARMHGEFAVSALVGHPYPSPERRLRGLAANDVDSWITLVFGAGVRIGSLLVADRVVLVDAEGASVPVEVRATRWSGNDPAGDTRLVTLRPTVELLPDADYTVILRPGIELLDGTLLEVEWTYTFTTRCADLAACPPPDVGWPPRAPMDAGVAPEPDLGVDAGPPDQGVDAAMRDVGAPLDGAPGDAMPPIDAAVDAGVDAAAPPASQPAGGCAIGPGR